MIKEIVSYNQYRVVEIKDTIYFQKFDNAWLSAKINITLKELFEFTKEDLLVFVLMSFGEYFRIKSSKGVVLERGWRKDGMIFENEIEGAEFIEEDSWLSEDEFYNKKGEIKNLKKYL